MPPKKASGLGAAL
jgi:hypothetical protein